MPHPIDSYGSRTSDLSIKGGRLIKVASHRTANILRLYLLNDNGHYEPLGGDDVADNIDPTVISDNFPRISSEAQFYEVSDVIRQKTLILLERKRKEEEEEARRKATGAEAAVATDK
jgi:hypothetical protein